MFGCRGESVRASLGLPAWPLWLLLGASLACSRTPLLDAQPTCRADEEACAGACVPADTCRLPGSGGAGGASTGMLGGATSNGGTGLTASVPCNDTASLERTMKVQYDGAFIDVTGSDKQYYVHTNWWSLYQGQIVKVKGLSYTLDNPSGAKSSNDMPMGFPSFFIGSYSGHSTRGSNLPKQVSALTGIPTRLASNAAGMGTSNYNVTYDVWFTASATPLPNGQYNPGSGGAYLMVWLFKPRDRQPRGTLRSGSAGVTVAGLPGTWDVWIDKTDPPCVSYVSAKPLERLDFDLNDVIEDAVTNGYGITSSMYLSLIFGGFEVWGGGDGLHLEAFCADVL